MLLKHLFIIIGIDVVMCDSTDQISTSSLTNSPSSKKTLDWLL